MGSWIWNLNFIPFVVNGLIKGEEKSSGQYLGLIYDESLTCWDLNSNPRHLCSFTFSLVSCGDSRFLISFCVGDRCDMTSNDEDLGRSRRPIVEDRVWSNTYWVLGGLMIGRPGDAVCYLHRAHKDEEHEFLDWASKLRLTVSWFVPQNRQLWFGDLGLKITATVSLFVHQNQTDFDLSVVP
jgi:hypothetical protein